jgi:hypothetical protein
MLKGMKLGGWSVADAQRPDFLIATLGSFKAGEET